MSRFLKTLVLALLAIGGSCSFLFAQLDTLHYLPPICRCNGNGSEGAIYLSTPSTSPVPFTISDGSGAVLASGNVSNAVPYRYDMTGNNATLFVTNPTLDSVLTDKGFIVRSNAPIYVNLRYVADATQQSLSITSKGTKAFGQSFRIAHTRSLPESISNATVSIMATDDNTGISIDLSGTGVVLRGPNAPNTATPINITLNRGESYVFAANTLANGTAAMDAMMGSLITSNKPIVTTMGQWRGHYASGNWDIGFDQPVSENLLGTQYAVLQGVGGNDKERVFVIANSNGTDVFVNGNPTPFATLNAGEHVTIPGNQFNADSVMFVQTSQPAYLWQMLFGANSWANFGLNFLPPTSCLTEQFVDNIPQIDSINQRPFSGNINLVTFAGSTVLVNGVAPAQPPVPVPGSMLSAYRLHGLSGDFSVYSNTIAVVGFYGRNGPSTFAGYYSGFDSIPEIFVSITDTVCPDTLFVENGFDSFQWLLNGSPIPAATDTFLSLNGTTGGFSVIVSKGACVDTSGTFTVACILPVTLASFSVDCEQAGSRKAHWQTVSESYTSHFEVQGSPNGLEWTSLVRVAARGHSDRLLNYYADLPFTQQAFFRLRTVDLNGSSSISEVFRTDCPDAQYSITASQPSAGQSGLQVQLTGYPLGTPIEFFHTNGQSLMAVPWRGESIQVDLPQGAYLVRASYGSESSSTKAMVWQ